MRIYLLTLSYNNLPTNKDWLSEKEQLHWQKILTVKKSQEWLFGRWTAKRMIEQYLKLENISSFLDYQTVEIKARKNGVPQAFLADKKLPINISISHRAKICFCALTQNLVKIGADVELIEPRSKVFLEDYFTNNEQDFLNRKDSNEQEIFANLFWSAKESTLKALEVGLTVDTRNIEILPITPELNNIWQPFFSLTKNREEKFFGWWRKSGEYVFTLVTNSPLAFPFSLNSLLAQE
jgi:4'-phosphopantetheinyl transferase